MKKILSVSLFLVLVVSLLTGCSGGKQSSAELPTMTIKVSHNQPTTSPEHAGAETFKKKVEELSDGKIKVDIYPSMQLGSMREQVEGVQMGSYELTIQPIAVLTSFVDEMQIVDFPFLWPSTDILCQVLDGKAGEKLLAKAEPKGFKGFGFWGSGFKQFTTNGKEIHRPEDFKGVKMRVIPSPLLIAQYQTWGGNAVPIEYAELYNALQQKIVDGQENPIQTIAMNKFYEVQDRLILSNHGYLAYVFIGNKAWFDKLPEQYQEIIIQAEEEARNIERKVLAEKENMFLEEIKKSNIKIYILTDEEKRAFTEASKPIHAEFASTPDKKEILELIYQEINEVK